MIYIKLEMEALNEERWKKVIEVGKNNQEFKRGTERI